MIPSESEDGVEDTEVEDENTKNETILESLIKFWDEIKDFKKHFNLNDCAEGIVLKVFLPVNDIISDFLFAEKLLESENRVVRQWFAFFAYS